MIWQINYVFSNQMKKIYLLIRKNVLLVSALLVFASSFLPQLQPIYRFFDSDKLAFTIGGARISLYLLLKGLFLIAVLLWGARCLADFGEKKIKGFLNYESRERTLAVKVFQIFVYVVAALCGLKLLGIDLTAFAVFGGAIGIGIGVGLQKTAANFISWLILLFEKTISEGDLLELEGGMLVLVKRISGRYTLVESFDKKEIMIPNEEFITHRIINWTFSNRIGRGEIEVGVAYGSDLEKVNDLLLQATKDHPLVLQEPAPSCYLIDFLESSIKFRVYFWVGNIIDGTLRVKSDILFNINKKFSEHGIKIPFPQREILVTSLPLEKMSLLSQFKS